MAGTASHLGSDEEFVVLYRQTFQQVYAYCLRRSFTAADAEDVSAEIYAIAWRKLNEFATADAPLAWLYGVGQNVLQNKRRSGHRSDALQLKVDRQVRWAAADPSEAAEARLDFESVAAAVVDLDHTDREIVLLTALEALSYKEVAAVLGLPVATVRTRLYRVRRHLNRVTRDQRETHEASDIGVVVDLRRPTTAPRPTVEGDPI